MIARAIVIAVALVLPATRAFADPDPRVAAEASAHFEAGVTLAKRGANAAALAEFEKAYALVSQWEILFNIGVTQRSVYRYGAAIKTFERYLADGADKVPADRRSRVEAELLELRKLVGELEIVIEGPPAKIEIGGAVEGETPLAGPLLVAPGTHVVRALRGNEVSESKSITIVSGERRSLELVFRVVPKTGRLTITTRPTTARIRLDGGPLLPTPWSGELAPGGVRVAAELDGYRPETSEIRIDAGQDRSLQIDLVALPRPVRKPWYRRPVVWIAIGVGVAATAGTVAYLAQPEKADVRVDFP